MSAFMCSTVHVNTIVVWAIEHQFLAPERAIEAQRGLVDANVKAMEARYVNRPEPNQSVVEELAEVRAYEAEYTDYARIYDLKHLAAVGTHTKTPEACALLHCFNYQCSEGTVPETHKWSVWAHKLQKKADKMCMAQGTLRNNKVWDI